MLWSTYCGFTHARGYHLHIEVLWQSHLTHRPHVHEQGAIIGDIVTERKVWHSGGYRRLKRSNTTEVHWGSDHPIPKGQI